MHKASGTRASKLRKLSGKFLHLCIDEQYSNNITSTHNRRNLRDILLKLLARVSLALHT